ncbi:hypothetical protein B0H21DRAFT_227544 [Amylocystis lapponica]|nr:hypothetical protein B0H21DRAFT_227544 [Amylocystis lapponica]
MGMRSVRDTTWPDNGVAWANRLPSGTYLDYKDSSHSLVSFTSTLPTLHTPPFRSIFASDMVCQFSGPHRVPHEISDRIIDNLYDDKDALKACSLTCQCFLPRAQFHYFSTLTLNADLWHGFERLRATRPQAVELVRSLKLTHSGNFSDRNLAWNYVAISRMLESVRASAWTFYAVTKLELHQVALTVPWTDMVVQHFLAVEELRVVGCIVSDATSLQKMATSFPRLKKLKMGELLILSGPDDVEPPTLPEISDLRFPSAFVDPQRPATRFLGWMIEKSLHTHIATLEIPIHRPREALVVQTLLEARGPGLKHLYFGLEPDGPADDLLDTPLSLSPCTGLRTLGFWSLKLHHDEPWNSTAHLGWMPVLLGQVNSPDLEHIHFRIRAGGSSLKDLNAIDWARVDDILAREEFEGLRRVTVEIVRGEAIKGFMTQYIKRRVPRLEARGIVRYIHHVSDL